MAEQVRVAIDDQGNVHVELSGYTDRRCEAVEDELRRQLMELGLRPEVVGRRLKTAAESEAETRGTAGPPPARPIEE